MPPQTDFLVEARRVVEAARQNNLTLRIMGAVAFRLHCPTHESLHRALGREISDLDLMGLRDERRQVEKLMVNLGYTTHEQALAETQGMAPNRLFLYDRHNSRVVDVFFDQLEMCHRIDFQNRLQTDYPTISLAELLLEKMQIVRLSQKDIKDTVVLLLEHPIADNDRESVNGKHIAVLLSDDWGFYYTTMENLRKVSSSLESFNVLGHDQQHLVENRIQQLMSIIEAQPKSSKWKMRARIGTKMKWYNDVEEIAR